MITLLLLGQITRDEFMDFKRQVEVQFAEIRGEIKELRSQVQALNQRIDDLRKDNENIRNDIRKQIKNWLLNLKKNLRIQKTNREEIKSEIELIKKL